MFQAADVTVRYSITPQKLKDITLIIYSVNLLNSAQAKKEDNNNSYKQSWTKQNDSCSIQKSIWPSWRNVSQI